MRGLLAAQASQWVRDCRFDGLEAKGEQGDEDHATGREGHDPPTHANTIGKMRQPLVHCPPGEG